MPELPEVECIRLCLQRLCVGSTITLHKLTREDIVGSLCFPRGRRGGCQTKTSKSRLLDGTKLVGFERKGKQLAFVCSGGRSLIFRLGMSGQILLVDVIDPDLKHVHVAWLLRSKGKSKYLLFRDPRRFGSILPCKDQRVLSEHWNRLGPDALSISCNDILCMTKGKSVGMKALLLNQNRMSGLGNIYVDEALFQAKIHPQKKSMSLNNKQAQLLAFSIRKILSRSIQSGGTTLRDYCVPNGSPGTFQQMHKVYGRQGLLCTSCQSIILSDLIAGRTTAFCPTCQEK